jgi:hypothetical protein
VSTGDDEFKGPLEVEANDAKARFPTRFGRVMGSTQE